MDRNWQRLFVPGKGSVESGRVRCEIQFADEGAAFGRAVDAIHAAILPFHGERAAIANVVQRDNDFLEVDVAVAERAEIPEAARVGEIRVAAKHADRAIAVAPPNILHVRVENTWAKFADELHIVHPLIAEVRRVVIEAEAPDDFSRRRARAGRRRCQRRSPSDALRARSGRLPFQKRQESAASVWRSRQNRCSNNLGSSAGTRKSNARWTSR